MVNNQCQGLQAQAKATSDTLKIISDQVMRVENSDNESDNEGTPNKLGQSDSMKNFKKSFQHLVGKNTFKTDNSFEGKLVILKQLVIKKKQE